MLNTLTQRTWSTVASVALAAFMLLFALLPFSTHAAVSVADLPDGATDITEEVFGEDPEIPGDSTVFAFDLPTEGETYEFIFESDEDCPAVVLSLGGMMTDEANWSCNAATYETTVTVEHTGFVSGVFDESEEPLEEGEEHEEGAENIMVIAMTNVAGEEGNGPGESERTLSEGVYTGMYMSTNVSEWEMVPPSPDNISFGFSLTGPFGEQGYFRFFMPQGTIDNLSGHAGEELTADDLAVFNDGNQASFRTITEVEGGALVDMSVLFVPAISAALPFSTASSETRMITKTLSAGQPQAISLAAKKTRLKKGRKALMYGWVQGASKGDKVRIDRGRTKKKVKRYKKCTEKSAEGACVERKKKFRTTTVLNDQGYYKFKVKATKKGWWVRTSAKVDGERVFSEKVQVKAKKAK